MNRKGERGASIDGQRGRQGKTRKGDLGESLLDLRGSHHLLNGEVGVGCDVSVLQSTKAGDDLLSCIASRQPDIECELSLESVRAHDGPKGEASTGVRAEAAGARARSMGTGKNCRRSHSAGNQAFSGVKHPRTFEELSRSCSLGPFV